MVITIERAHLTNVSLEWSSKMSINQTEEPYDDTDLETANQLNENNEIEQEYEMTPDLAVTTDRENSGTKRLKMTISALIALLISFVAMGVAFNRYEENKQIRKQQEAEAALESKQVVDTNGGRVDIGSDLKDLTAQDMYTIAPPIDGINANSPTLFDPNAANLPPPVLIPDIIESQVTPNYQTYDRSPIMSPAIATPVSQLTMPTFPTRESIVADIKAYDAVSPNNTNNNQNSSDNTAPVRVPISPQEMKRRRLLGTNVMGYESAALNAASSQGIGQESQNGSDFASNFSGTELVNGRAQRRGDTSLLMAKGTNIPCVLKTKIVSNYQGFTTCQVSKNVYSANGKILLIERGSSVFGEQKVELKQGIARVFVLWTKIETPKGVSVNLDSPATGQLGEMGIGADVNNNFWKRFGGAIMLSLIQDSIKVATSRLEDRDEVEGDNNTTVQSTSRTTESIAEKALENTINIAPTATVPQGTILNILVVRDIDFGSVYGYR